MSEEIKIGGGDNGGNEPKQVAVKPVMSIAITEDGKVIFKSAGQITAQNKEFFLNVLTDVMKSVINVKTEQSSIIQSHLTPGAFGFRNFLKKKR